MTARIRTALRATYEVRVWQWILVQTTLLVLCFGAVFGGVSYMREQREAADRDVAQAAYLAEVAGYENARDEWQGCLAAVVGRENFRNLLFRIEAAFAGQVDVVRAVNPNSPAIPGLQEQVDDLHADIVADYPPRDPAECGDEPTRPEPPR